MAVTAAASKPEIADYGDIIEGRNSALTFRAMRWRRYNRFALWQPISNHINEAANTGSDREE